MERLTRLVRSHFDSWQKNLQSILEPPRLEDPRIKSFEVSTDLKILQTQLSGLAHRFPELPIETFSHLSPFFDAGLLLCRQLKPIPQGRHSHDMWAPSAGFYNSQYFSLEIKKQALCTLPPMKTLDLRKTAPFALLAPLHLAELCDSPDASAFVIKAHPDFIFCLFSKMAEPWLRFHIESTHEILKAKLLHHG
jgi:hypothetical protein